MAFNLVELLKNQLDELGLFSVLQVFYQLEFRAFAAVVLSFLIVLLLGRRTIRWLLRQKIGDCPEFYHADLNVLMANKANTPTMGGILICGSILVTVLLLADLTEQYVHLALIVLVWLAVLGGADDWLKLTSGRRQPGSREGLYVWEKLLFQLGIGFVAGYFLYRYGLANVDVQSDPSRVLNLPFQRTYDADGKLASDLVRLPPWTFIVLTMVLIAGLSNAVNLTDGMDGLAGGSMAVASFTMMVLCYIAGTFKASTFLLVPYVEGSGEMMVVAGAMAGACLGFLWFNCAPAQVFMGDTGALPLGGLLAYVAVVIRQEVLLIVIGGIFLMEMFSVILQVGHFKATGGRRILRCSPVHHHFHLGGWSEQQVVVRFWVLAAVFAMIALVSIKLR